LAGDPVLMTTSPGSLITKGRREKIRQDPVTTLAEEREGDEGAAERERLVSPEKRKKICMGQLLKRRKKKSTHETNRWSA